MSSGWSVWAAPPAPFVAGSSVRLITQQQLTLVLVVLCNMHAHSNHQVFWKKTVIMQSLDGPDLLCVVEHALKPSDDWIFRISFTEGGGLRDAPMTNSTTLDSAKQIAAVCRTWLAAVRVWLDSVTSFDMGRANNGQLAHFVKTLVLDRVRLTCSNTSESGLLSVAHAYPNLVELQLSIFTLMPAVPEVLRSCPRIKKLTLEHAVPRPGECAGTALVMSAPHAVSLTHLELRGLSMTSSFFGTTNAAMLARGELSAKALLGSIKFGFPALTHLSCPSNIKSGSIWAMCKARPDVKFMASDHLVMAGNRYLDYAFYAGESFFCVLRWTQVECQITVAEASALISMMRFLPSALVDDWRLVPDEQRDECLKRDRSEEVTSSKIALAAFENLVKLPANLEPMIEAGAVEVFCKLLRSPVGRHVDDYSDCDGYQDCNGEPARTASRVLEELVHSPAAEIDAPGLVASMLSLMSDMLRAEIGQRKEFVDMLEEMDAQEREELGDDPFGLKDPKAGYRHTHDVLTSLLRMCSARPKVAEAVIHDPAGGIAIFKAAILRIVPDDNFLSTDQGCVQFVQQYKSPVSGQSDPTTPTDDPQLLLVEACSTHADLVAMLQLEKSQAADAQRAIVDRAIFARCGVGSQEELKAKHRAFCETGMARLRQLQGISQGKLVLPDGLRMRMEGAPLPTALVLPPLSERVSALTEAAGSFLLDEDTPSLLKLSSLSTNLLYFVHEDDVNLVKIDGCAEFYEPKVEGKGRLLAILMVHPSRDDDPPGALRLLTEEEMEKCILQESQITLHHADFQMTFNPSNMAWFSANDLFDAIGHFETAKAQAAGDTNMHHAFFEGLVAHGSQLGHYQICWGS